MRCFIGCFLTPDSASRLRAACPDIAGVRWTPTENYHVTLHFIGNVAEESIDELCDLIESLHGRPRTCTVEGWRGYPGSRRARVLAAKLADDPELTSWSTALRSQWPTAEDNGRPFEPHVTVARSKRGTRLKDPAEPQDLSVELSAPALYRSHTLREGARYEAVRA